MTSTPDSFKWTAEWANENRAPSAKFMDFHVQRIGDGFAQVTMEYGPEKLESMGMYNAGVLLSLADTAAMFAARTVTDPGLTLDPDRFPLVIQLVISLVSNADHGQISALARVVHGGRTTQVVETAVTNMMGHLIAKVTSTHVTVPRSAARHRSEESEHTS